jgi:peptidoglycan/LPS O-acetylase OafA/YrhL
MKLQKLESLRGIAAVYVMLTHSLLNYLKPFKLDIFLRFGQEAVMLFFLLSGFVIYYSSMHSYADSFKNYFIKRFRRIYPMVICAFILSYILTVIQQKSLQVFDWSDLLGNLLMLQDFGLGKPGVWFEGFLGNTPLWSLSYEWWFYMMFYPLCKFVPKPYQFLVVIGLSLFGYITYFAYHNHISIVLMYFVIWWSGVQIAEEYIQNKRVTFHGQKLTLFILTLFVILISIQVILFKGELYFGRHPILELRHFSVVVILIILGIIWQNFNFIGFNQTIGLFTVFAPISYGIYILHYPIIGVLSNYIQLPSVTFMIAFILTCTLAYLLEVKLQTKINKFSLRFMDKKT